MLGVRLSLVLTRCQIRRRYREKLIFLRVGVFDAMLQAGPLPQQQRCQQQRAKCAAERGGTDRHHRTLRVRSWLSRPRGGGCYHSSGLLFATWLHFCRINKRATFLTARLRMVPQFAENCRSSLVAVQLLLELATLLCFERQCCRRPGEQARNTDRLTGFFTPAIVACID